MEAIGEGKELKDYQDLVSSYHFAMARREKQGWDDGLQPLCMQPTRGGGRPGFLFLTRTLYNTNNIVYSTR